MFCLFVCVLKNIYLYPYILQLLWCSEIKPLCIRREKLLYIKWQMWRISSLQRCSTIIISLNYAPLVNFTDLDNWIKVFNAFTNILSISLRKNNQCDKWKQSTATMSVINSTCWAKPNWHDNCQHSPFHVQQSTVIHMHTCIYWQSCQAGF